jgi:poly(A) polymerase
MFPAPETSADARRRFAMEVVRTLRAAGHEAYWAGGCVRDQLLGLAPKDYDVATSATPQEVQRAFGPRRTLAIGAAFGVIAVLGGKAAGQIEVATFRQDAGYSDGRRPDAVIFSRPEQDAQRRDFTINGLFYDPLAERVIDFVGGEEDLRRGIVRAIGDPEARFAEDKLRLLRAVRFAARFGFRLDDRTREAVCRMAGQITVVSAERIAQEMRAMLVHPARANALRLLLETDLLAALLPEVLPQVGLPWPTPRDPRGDLWGHVLRLLDELVEPGFPLVLAALLYGVALPVPSGQADLQSPAPEALGASVAEKVCRRWKLANKETERAVWLVRHRRALAAARQLPWPRLQRLLVTDGIEDLVALHEAEARAAGGDLGDVEHCRRLLAMPSEELNPPPLITGDDLIARGLPEGKKIKALLERARDAQLEKAIRDKAEALALIERLLAERDASGDATAG